VATASVTISNWNSTNSWENLADAGNTALIAYSRDATDAAGKFTCTVAANATEAARSATVTDTWASIFGISTSAIVTSYSVTAWKRKLIGNDKLDAISFNIGITDPNGSNAWVSAGSANTGSVNAGGSSLSKNASYTAQTAGGARTVDSSRQASTTEVRLWLECYFETRNSANVDARLDDVTYQITWSLALTAAQASFSLTGQNAGFTVSRLLAMAQGSLAMTGQAAGLRVARTLSCAVGAYGLTGQAATLKASRQLTMGQASFAFTGQSANLLRGVPLPAAMGAFTLTGQAAGLVASRTLTMEQGSFALTGQSTLISFLYSLQLAQAIYAMTGQDAGLRASRRLALAQASFASTGQAATLKVQRVLTAGTGAFTLTGQAMLVRRRLTMTHGTFALTGNAATFRHYYRTSSPRRIRVEAQDNTVTVRSRA